LYRTTVRQAPALPQTNQASNKAFQVSNSQIQQSLALVQTNWLDGQERYHENNARQMGRAKGVWRACIQTIRSLWRKDLCVALPFWQGKQRGAAEWATVPMGLAGILG